MKKFLLPLVVTGGVVIATTQVVSCGPKNANLGDLSVIITQTDLGDIPKLTPSVFRDKELTKAAIFEKLCDQSDFNDYAQNKPNFIDSLTFTVTPVEEDNNKGGGVYSAKVESTGFDSTDINFLASSLFKSIYPDLKAGNKGLMNEGELLGDSGSGSGSSIVGLEQNSNNLILAGTDNGFIYSIKNNGELIELIEDNSKLFENNKITRWYKLDGNIYICTAEETYELDESGHLLTDEIEDISFSTNYNDNLDLQKEPIKQKLNLWQSTVSTNEGKIFAGTSNGEIYKLKDVNMFKQEHQI